MNNIELHVFDINLNRLGIIDTISQVEIKKNYYGHSILNLIVEGNKRIKDLLLINSNNLTDELRIICLSNNLEEGYIVESNQLTDSQSTTISVTANSLSKILAWRLVVGQQRYNGTLTNVFNEFVNKNCISTTTTSRIIPRLTIGSSGLINQQIDETFTNKQLDISLWELCSKYEVTFKILINHSNKRFEFLVEKGTDRSTAQNINPHVIFAKEFENVISQDYIDDKNTFKSTAYVYGEGEGTERLVAEVNGAVSGFNRRELFLDARDLQSKYNESGTTITIPQAEYLELLKERGINRLQDYKRIITFKSEVNPQSNFIFNRDYFLGDIVTNRSKDLGIIMHNRIVSSLEFIDRNGYSLTLEFGTSVPTLIDKLKREVK